MKINYKDMSLTDFVKDLASRLLIANDLYCDYLQADDVESASKPSMDHAFLAGLLADIEHVLQGGMENEADYERDFKKSA